MVPVSATKAITNALLSKHGEVLQNAAAYAPTDISGTNQDGVGVC
jgi:hypothetical protein